MQTGVLFHANYNATKPIIVNAGGTSCFDGETLVVTDKGLKKISEIEVGDVVKSFNEKTKEDEWKTVTDTFTFLNQKRTVRVKLKNGKEIICTDDHKFYYKGGWISIKHLLSLSNETNTKL